MWHFSTFSHARRLVRSAPLTWTAAFVLIGVGVSAAAIGMALGYDAFVRPLPYPQAHRLVRLIEDFGPGAPNAGDVISSPSFVHLAEATHSSLDALGAYRLAERTVVTGVASREAIASVTPSVLDLLGIAPAIGRGFAAGEPRAAIASLRFWNESLGASAAAIGSTIAIDGEPFVLVGVAPPGVRLPEAEPALFVPLELTTVQSATLLSGIARLADGGSAARASVEATTILRRAPAPSPALTAALGADGATAIRAVPLQAWMGRGMRTPVVLALLGAVTLLGLVCVNVSTLLLARHASRRGEWAMRRILGASRGRLVTELLVEAATVGLGGAVVGAALSVTGLAGLRASGLDVTNLVAAGPLLVVSAVSLGLGALVAIVVGVAPLTLVSRSDLTAVLRGSDVGTGVTANVTWRRVSAALLVAQSALAMVVVVIALLLSRSLASVMSVDPGYMASSALTIRIHVPGVSEAAAADRLRVGRQVLEAVRQLPGVVAAGISNMTPFGQASIQAGFPVPGDFRRPTPSASPPRMATALRYTVTEGYGEALGLRLKAGRLLDRSDGDARDMRWVVNEEFARLYLPANPVGLRFPWMLDDREADLEIVGVVAPVLKDGLDRDAQPEIYVPLRGAIWGPISMVVRADGDAAALVPRLRGVVAAVAPHAVVDATTLSAAIAESTARSRRARNTFLALAVVSLLLAGYGLYSAHAHALAQRRSELAVRLALGASTRSLVWRECRRLAALAGAGIAAGAWLAFAVAGSVSSFLFGLGSADPVAYGAGAVVVLLALALAAIPFGARMFGVNPAEVLREH